MANLTLNDHSPNTILSALCDCEFDRCENCRFNVYEDCESKMGDIKKAIAEEVMSHIDRPEFYAVVIKAIARKYSFSMEE